MSREIPSWVDDMPYTPCNDFIFWARGRPSLKAAWRVCPRGDWLLFHLVQVARFGGPGDTRRRPLVGVLLECADLARIESKETRLRVNELTDPARRWAAGRPVRRATLNKAQVEMGRLWDQLCWGDPDDNVLELYTAAVQAPLINSLEDAWVAASYAEFDNGDRLLRRGATLVRRQWPTLPEEKR